MGKNKSRFSVTVSEEMYNDVNTYQHENKLSTQTKAIVEILQIGLNEINHSSCKSSNIQSEAKEDVPRVNALIHNFLVLNETGRDRLMEYAGLLALKRDFRKRPEYLVDSKESENKPEDTVVVWEAARSKDNDDPAGWVERPAEEIDKIFNAPDADVNF